MWPPAWVQLSRSYFFVSTFRHCIWKIIFLLDICTDFLWSLFCPFHGKLCEANYLWKWVYKFRIVARKFPSKIFQYSLFDLDILNLIEVSKFQRNGEWKTSCNEIFGSVTKYWSCHMTKFQIRVKFNCTETRFWKCSQSVKKVSKTFSCVYLWCTMWFLV